MAEKRISELTAKGSNLQSTDLIEVSVSAGGGAYNTRYITGAQITAAVSAVNIYNSNGTLTGSRTVTGGGFSLTFTGVDQYTSIAEAHTFKNITGGNNLFKITTPSTFGSNVIQFGRNNIDNNCGQIYSNDVSISMQYNSGNVIASMFANGFKVGGNGAVSPTSRLNVISPSASALDTAFSIRNNTDTLDLFGVKANGVLAMSGSQVGNVGLSSGDTYFDTASNILSNGDLILARKV